MRLTRRLRARLEAVRGAYGRAYLATDPVLFPRRYGDPADREVVAFVASAFAYGNAVAIRATLERLFATMGESPRRFVEAFEARGGARPFAGFVYRWHREEDLLALLVRLRAMLRGFGSVEAFFGEGNGASSGTLRDALASFSSRALALEPDAVPSRGTRFFFPSPEAGSPCKRLCLFLRWVARPDDGVDLGLWRTLDPSRLVLPLDTHLFRASRCLGLTNYATPSWRAAEEATAALARLDRSDPVRYDFALCRLGMLERCYRPGESRPCSLCPRRAREGRRR